MTTLINKNIIFCLWLCNNLHVNGQNLYSNPSVTDYKHKLNYSNQGNLLSDSIFYKGKVLFRFNYYYDKKNNLKYITSFYKNDSIHIYTANIESEKLYHEEWLADTLSTDFPDGLWAKIWFSGRKPGDFETMKEKKTPTLYLFSDSTRVYPGSLLIKEECVYKKHIKTGKHIFYDNFLIDSLYLVDRYPMQVIKPSDNGIKQERIQFGDKMLTGRDGKIPSKDIFIRGSPWYIFNYKNGIRDGWSYSLTGNGKVHFTFFYRKDTVDQEITYYPKTDTSQILEIKSYTKKGKNDLYGYYYKTSGSVTFDCFEEGYYKNAKKDGEWVECSESNKYFLVIYNNGKVVSRKKINKPKPKFQIKN